MKLLIYISLLVVSFSACSDDISNYKYYQIDSNISDGKGPFYAVYIKNDNPCIFIKDFKKKQTQEFCQMGDSPFDLKRDSPSIYPTQMKISAFTLHFIVAAPWNEQKCEISLIRKSISCESTGL
ncbi:hypothetical protein [uncultured Shewanella sp.]|uniref:hypothetical protein n=1 Tax=uncultured Shewanella sp. TaxID=173975 RepID=UPI00262EDC00|nr:hypothetical protein [uncultured Shewanella sp.]